MATSSLLAAVSAGLSGAASLGYTSSSAAHDVYEAYILTLFLRAADQEHWHWELHDQSCSLTSYAVFRMGPGRLPSGNFTHVHLTKRGKVSLEAHIGVKVAGISPVRHEFDLRSAQVTPVGAAPSTPILTIRLLSCTRNRNSTAETSRCRSAARWWA